MFRLILAAILLAVACQSPAASPKPISLHAGDSGQLELAGGRYQVTWSAAGCTYLDLRWTPATGPSTVIPAPLPAGSATVTLPAGAGYLNRSADCDYSLTLQPAA